MEYRKRRKRRRARTFFVAVSIVILIVITGFRGVDISKNETSNECFRDEFCYEPLSQEMKERMTGNTFPEQFPAGYYRISYDDLACVRIKYYDFEGMIHDDGELIVHKEVAQEVAEIFYELYINEYPLHSVRLADDFGGSDEESMAANNTSAFNYRIIENTDQLSWHCFGLAVDVNPRYNPYLSGGVIYPANATEYTDRSKTFAGKIDENDLAYKLFTQHGWLWGGDFADSPDYQHFYKEGIVDNRLRYKTD